MIPGRRMERMLDKMKSLVRKKDTCVLATVSGVEPHCSLMSYATDDDCREVYMITHKQTKKYRNLLHNGKVSLLIDTREEGQDVGREVTKALTISGVFQKIEGEQEKKEALQRLLTAHPHLRKFADTPDAEVFAVRIRSFQLLEGIGDSSFVALD
jgi:nitroimidazol reductase NimA-like FMN-containing flavoprotein (pyridoxamine 5'-phosphate oxidase superfamily)